MKPESTQKEQPLPARNGSSAGPEPAVRRLMRLLAQQVVRRLRREQKQNR
jgi:hypothetical protein